MAKILVVEDQPEIGERLKKFLMSERHVVEHVATGVMGLEHLHSAAYDICILDWQLGDMSGLDVCQQYKNQGGNTLILMLTGKAQVKDKVSALSLGADDYLTKPFDPDELLAKVRALIRRTGSQSVADLRVGGLCINMQSHSASIDSTPLDLTPTEFSLLEFLMRNPNIPFNYQSLLVRVWSDVESTSEETVRACLSNLRKKLTESANPKREIIQTLRGVGYKLAD